MVKLTKVIETLSRRIEWLELRLSKFDNKDAPAFHFMHQEYIALQEAAAIVAKEAYTLKPVKAI